MIDDEQKFNEEFDIRRRQTATALKPELEVMAAKLAMWDELVDALEWCGEHAYAGGKSFAVVEPVKSALERARSIK